MNVRTSRKLLNEMMVQRQREDGEWAIRVFICICFRFAKFEADASRQPSWRIDWSRTTSEAFNCSSSYLHSDSRLQFSQPSILDIISGSYTSTGMFVLPSCKFRVLFSWRLGFLPKTLSNDRIAYFRCVHCSKFCYNLRYFLVEARISHAPRNHSSRLFTGCIRQMNVILWPCLRS